MPWLAANAAVGIGFTALLHREGSFALEHAEALVDAGSQVAPEAADLAARLLDLGTSLTT